MKATKQAQAKAEREAGLAAREKAQREEQEAREKARQEAEAAKAAKQAQIGRASCRERVYTVV